RTLPKTLAISAAVIGAIAFLCFYPADFKLEGDAKLRPKIRKNVYAQVDGLIKKVNVEHDDLVHKGDVLLVQESPDLDKEMESIRGQLSKDVSTLRSTRDDLDRNEELTEAERSKKESEVGQLKESIKSFQKQLDSLNIKKEILKICSPI